MSSEVSASVLIGVFSAEPECDEFDKDVYCREQEKICHPIAVSECVGRRLGSDAPGCYRKAIRKCLPSICAANY